MYNSHFPVVFRLSTDVLSNLFFLAVAKHYADVIFYFFLVVAKNNAAVLVCGRIEHYHDVQ